MVFGIIFSLAAHLLVRPFKDNSADYIIVLVSLCDLLGIASDSTAAHSLIGGGAHGNNSPDFFSICSWKHNFRASSKFGSGIKRTNSRNAV